MGRVTSFSLGDHFNSFVEEQVKEGRYDNASERATSMRSGITRRIAGDSSRLKPIPDSSEVVFRR